MKLNLFQLSAVVFTLGASTAVYGQGDLAGISGKITDNEGFDLPQVTVIVKNESTGFTTSTKTNEKGEYNLKQLPLGSPYTITIISEEHGEEILKGYSLNQGDLIWVPFKFSNGTTTSLNEVTVNGQTLKSSIKQVGASTSVSAKDLQTLPVNGRNFTSLIDLSPLSNGTSIGGQLSSSVDYTIDGMSNRGTIAGGSTSSSYSISMEAIREFKVVTNEYDVTNGRSGGGTISTVTKSGTNKLEGSAFLYGRADWLSSPYDIRGNKRDNEFSTFQYGFSLGGPIKKDKAHFFVAWDRQVDKRPLLIANINNPSDEALYNVTQSTLDQFLSIARDKYGVSNNPQFGSFDKNKDTNAAFLRVDWQLNARNLLTLRNNFVHEMDKLSEGDNTSINMYESYIDRKKTDNSLMLSLRTDFNDDITNELKVQHFVEHQNIIPSSELPSQSIPRAIVESIGSQIGEKTQYTNIQLGGQRFSPEWFKGNVLQLVNNVYINRNNIKYTLGGDFSYYHMKNVYGSEMNGRFYFTGMDNFKNMTPYRYAREIRLTDDPSTVINQLSSAVYGQLETEILPGLDLMAGIRFENMQYLNAANYNEVADKQLGVRTDNKINTWQIQPRFQLTWDINQNRKDFIKFGGGIFGSSLNPYSMINNMLFDGTKVAAVDIVGNLVPTPDFIDYRQNPDHAPGKDLFNNPAIEKLITINANSKEAKVPTVYKLNASYNHFFSDRLRVGISAYANWARNNYMYVDRNMVDEPYFRIKEEANRGVYVPASTINPTNGAANWVNGRKTNELGRVLELISDGKKDQYAIVLDGTYRYFKDGQISVSYTWNDSKDNTSYNGNVANTATLSLMVAEDPRNLSKMNYSDTHFRHKLVVYGQSPTFWGMTAGIRFSGIGGTRYSLAVNGNMNGDFVNSNDLAYIYDPNSASTPEYLKKGIQAILDNPEVEKHTKEYIRKSFGKIAERNGGINGFSGTFDLRLAKKIKIVEKHRFEVAVDIFNVANLMNKEWGVGPRIGKQNIYSIKSFDTANERFVYNVNTNTGKTSYAFNPYQIQIGFRYSF